MHPLYWIANRVQRLFTPDISGKPVIALQPFPSPQRVYTDIRNVIRSGDPCDEKGSVYYLRSDVRYKIGEGAVWQTVDLGCDYYDQLSITIGGTELTKKGDCLAFAEFMMLPGLSDVLIEIMKTPFKVTLYDLDESKGGYTSWFKMRKETINKLKKKIANYSAATTQAHPYTSEVITIVNTEESNLDEVVKNIEGYCNDTLETIQKMSVDIVQALIFMQKEETCKKGLEILHNVEVEYTSIMQELVGEVNEYLQNFVQKFPAKKIRITNAIVPDFTTKM